MTYKFKSVKILVVDDMKSMLDLTRDILKIFGFEHIYTADNGADAFEIVCNKKPDLIITDWIMEPMDGMKLTKLIRTDKRSPDKFVPIILMTGYSSRLRVEEARDSGITEFLVKPFTSKDLYKRVHQIIEKPRKFVEANEFFGPDRRRRMDANYTGKKRREEETANAQENNTDEYSDNFKTMLKSLRQETKSL